MGRKIEVKIVRLLIGLEGWVNIMDDGDGYIDEVVIGTEG